MATCLHGFEPGQCLICQTLGPAPPAGSPGRRAATRAERRAARMTASMPSGRPVEVVDGRSHAAVPRAASHIAIAALMVVVAVITFWLVAGVIFALLRLLEIVAVAAIAGTLGYRLGRARGHREH